MSAQVLRQGASNPSHQAQFLQLIRAQEARQHRVAALPQLGPHAGGELDV